MYQTLVLWGAKSHVQQYFTPRDVWPQYASNIVGFEAPPASHCPQEQAPEETYRALASFLNG